MTSPVPEYRKVTIHLTAQATVEFTADQLWPSHGTYSRFGTDLDSFAEEVGRRLHTDSYVGCRPSNSRIMMIPLAAIKRIDFTDSDPGSGSGS